MHNYADQKSSESRLPVGVVGARGYSGLELVRILARHPQIRLQACFSGESTLKLEDYLPAVESTHQVVPMQELEAYAASMHTIFLATPAEVSLELAPKILKAGANVIDLSGAFRLKQDSQAQYKKWYGFEHPAPALLETAEYGLVPWVSSERRSQGPRLIANPGCYATSILLALLPLMKAGAIDPATVVIDAKSGTSGAGRKAAENLLFTEVEGECLPYRVGRHQHLPEIQEAIAELSGSRPNSFIEPFFSTSLLPIRRGIISAIYARLTGDLENVVSAYASAYADSKLISVTRLEDRDGRPNQFALSLRQVVGTAQTRIAFTAQGDRLYVFSLIDNLMKGAASQAVENFNRLAGLPTETALTDLRGIL